MARIIMIMIGLLMVVSGALPAAAETVMTVQSLVTPQNVDFEYCNKIFNVNSERLFYLTIASINANKFRIDEIQTKSGYILFTAANKQFLANISELDSKRSLLKVTPANNIYYFPLGIVVNLFKYIELNTDLQTVELKKI